jgi:hypothetical protein
LKNQNVKNKLLGVLINFRLIKEWTLNKKMKKLNLKLLLVLFFGLFLFLSTSFYSCDKPRNLTGTSWESDSLEIKYQEPFLLPDDYLHKELLLRGKMTISFVEPHADIFIKGFELYDSINDVVLHKVDNLHAVAGSTYYGKTLTLYFDTTGYFSGQTWVGTVNKRTMDLRFFGEEIRLNRR